MGDNVVAPPHFPLPEEEGKQRPSALPRGTIRDYPQLAVAVRSSWYNENITRSRSVFPRRDAIRRRDTEKKHMHQCTCPSCGTRHEVKKVDDRSFIEILEAHKANAVLHGIK